MNAILGFIGGVLGAIVGYVITAGNPAGAALGWTIGSAIGGLAGMIFFGADTVVTKGPRLDDLSVQTSTYGVDIPKIYGTARVAGNIFWATDLVERRKTRHLDGSAKYIEYTYYGRFAVGLCEGVISGIRKIYLDGKLYADMSDSASVGTAQLVSIQRGTHWRVYDGAEDQAVDPDMGGDVAYRGLAYILFWDLPLANYGNRIPVVTCEVVANGFISSGTFLSDDCSGAIPITEKWDPKLHQLWNPVSYNSGYLRVDNESGAAGPEHGKACATLFPQQAGGQFELDFNYWQNNDWYSDALTSAEAEFAMTPGDPVCCTLSTCYHQVEENGYGADSKLAFNLRTATSGKITVRQRINGVFTTLFNEDITYHTGSFHPLRIKIDVDNCWFEIYDRWSGVSNVPIAEGSETQIGERTDFDPELMDYLTAASNYVNFTYHFHNLMTAREVHFDNIVFKHGKPTAVEIQAPTENNTHRGICQTSEGHLISCDTTTRLISLHDGPSETVLSQFICPNPLGTATATPVALCTWNGDLFVAFNENDGDNHPYISLHYGYTQATQWIQEVNIGTNSVIGGIAIFNGFLYVADCTQNKIFKFPGIDPTETPVAEIAGSGNANSGANIYGLTFDVDGNLYESNNGDEKIFKHTGEGAVSGTLEFTEWEDNCLSDLYWNKDAEMLWVARITTHSFYGLDGFTKDVLQVNKVVSVAPYLSNVVADVCDSCGLDTGQYDVSQLEGLYVAGYVRAQCMTGRRVIEPLMASYMFDCSEYDHKLNFVLRGGASQATITEDEIGAYEYTGGAKSGRLLQIQKGNEHAFPREFNLSFISPVKDYEPGIARSVRRSSGSNSVAKVEYPIVMQHSFAKQLAEILHNTMWTERIQYQFITYLKYLWLAPSDVVTVAGRLMRIVKMNIKQGLLQMECVAEEQANYVSDAVADDPTGGGQTIDLEPPTVSELMDISMLVDADNNIGFYVAAHGYGASGWNGCKLYVDAGSGFAESLSVIDESYMGTSTDALAEQTVYPGTFDDINTVNIQLDSTNWSLSNATMAQVLAGSNWAALGAHGRWEIIGFMTATLESDGSYTLSGILRGIRGTEWAMALHQSYDRFVMLDTDIVGRLLQGASMIDVEFDYKMLSMGVNPEFYTSKTFTNHAQCLHPYAPCDIRAARDGSNNITLTWKRRTRVGGEWEDYQDVPLGETSEAYEIDIMDGASVKRAVTGLSSATYTYTIADQTTDWGGAKNPVTVRIYQISSVVGRGYTNEVSV